MNISMDYPIYAIILLFGYIFTYASITLTRKFDKIFFTILLAFWSFASGYITYANMLQNLIKH